MLSGNNITEKAYDGGEKKKRKNTKVLFGCILTQLLAKHEQQDGAGVKSTRLSKLEVQQTRAET